MQTYLIDTTTGTWYNAAGGRFSSGTPTIPWGAQDEIKIILVTGRTAQYGDSSSPAEAWPRDTTRGEYSAVITADADFYHRQQGSLTEAAGASVTVDIPDLVPTALPASGTLRVFDAAGTAETVSYAGFLVYGTKVTFNTAGALSKEYPTGSRIEAPQIPYCSAVMDSSKSDPANGEFVFDLLADSPRLRADMAQHNKSTLTVAGLEFLLLKDGRPAQSFLCSTFRISGTLHAWEDAETGDGSGSPGGGGSAGGAGKFYECTAVDDGEGTPAIPEVKAGITISGDITESVKGFYPPQGDTSDFATAVWGSGSYYIYKCSSYDYWLISPSLNDPDPGNAYYYAEYRSGQPPWEASNWQGNYGGGTIKITGSLTDTPAVPEVPATGVKSWTGYEWLLADGIYGKAETLTEGLSWDAVKPKVGKSYSADALVEMAKFYQGFSVPEEGIVFACMMDNASTTATGESINNNGGVFQEYKGLPAVYMNGSSNLSIYSYNLDSIMGSNPCTMSCWLYFPEAQTVQDHPYYAFTYGNRGGGGGSRCIGVHGDGSVKADTWNGATGGNVIGGWHHACATFVSNTANLYIDGELVATGSCSLSTESPWVYIGCTSSSDPHFIGYVGPCRIYNRVLDEDEIMGLYKEYSGKIQK